MKKVTSRFLPIVCATLLGTLSAISASQAATLMLNFSLGNAATNTPSNARTISGYTNVCAPFVGNAVNASVTNINGTGANFTINNVSSYDTGKDNEPLTTSGFYTYNNDSSDHTFTLSGLTVGSTVTLYAVASWDGNGRGGVLSFGTSSTQAQTIGDPGTAPTLANFTQINTVPVIVGTNGTVTGYFYGAGGAGSNTEGQIGGFIFNINTPTGAVPEPSSVALLLLGGAALLGFVRYRSRAAQI